MYAGCVSGGGGYSLTLINGTISSNTATGTAAVAGLDGESNDHVTLENTIDAANTGGLDLGGFGATNGANATADHSDCVLRAARRRHSRAPATSGSPVELWVNRQRRSGAEQGFLG